MPAATQAYRSLVVPRMDRTTLTAVGETLLLSAPSPRHWLADSLGRGRSLALNPKGTEAKTGETLPPGGLTGAASSGGRHQWQ
jgi:hypothetical protein